MSNPDSAGHSTGDFSVPPLSNEANANVSLEPSHGPQADQEDLMLHPVVNPTPTSNAAAISIAYFKEKTNTDSVSGGNAAEEWIDRTNEPLGKIGNGYQLTSQLESLCLTNNRLKKIERLEPCVNLTDLVLRQNAITIVEGLHTLQNLTELDLYMNAISHIPPDTFSHNPKLQKLDLSFNQLRSLDSFPSHNLSNLQELYLIGNKIKKITPLTGMSELTMLELGDNRIRDIENLNSVPSLQGLWLGRNKISAIQNLDALTNLRRLSLQSNRITAIEGLSHLANLEELYLSHNGLTSMEGIDGLHNLVLLDLGSNEISQICGVDQLPHLKEFWFNNNRLETLNDLNLLCVAKGLETVYLEGNPIAMDPDYQKKVLSILPDSLEQLDAVLVKNIENGVMNSDTSEAQ